MQVLFILLAILVLVLWCARSYRLKKSIPPKKNKTSVQPVAEARPTSAAVTGADISSTIHSDVQFRMQGERGAGGPIYGDVLCSDGVYLPHVWESDFHTSFDGRWIRTGSYGDSTPRLLDRKTRRSWLLSVAEAALVDDLHWRLPHWSGESEGGNGVAAESRNVLSDTAFDAWLTKHVSNKPQPLIAVCDLWIPEDCVPLAAQALPPVLPQPDNAVVQVTAQRHWPQTLRNLPNPLEPLHQPQWQLQLNGEPHAWIVDDESHFVWRPDGQAFACYGVPAAESGRQIPLRLGVWSLNLGGQQWSQWLPEDRKPWAVGVPMDVEGGSTSAALWWDGPELLQRVLMDNPVLERLHNGRSLSCEFKEISTPNRHRDDGRLMLQKIPLREFFWRRDLHNPTRWVAQSLPVAGQALTWELVNEAKDELGSTAGYIVQWGEQQLPGVWELEHLIVDGQWALLCPWGESPLRGGKPAPWVWDGKQLNAISMAQPILRMRPHALPGRAQMLAVVGCGPDNSNLASTGLWRWPLQIADETNLTKNGWTPAYEWRDVAVNAQGVWQLQPRWRTVVSVQHPCADGDYFWQPKGNQDAVWWLGGLHYAMDNMLRPQAPRCEGVLVTQTGAVLCGVGPSICPHHSGDGWLSLEWLARGPKGQAHHWKLHWLRPSKHEVWTLELRAFMPVLQAWDAQQGVQWMDTDVPPAQEGGKPQTEHHIVAPMRWESAQLEVLKQTPVGLWTRKQDAVYADAIALRDDWPWERVVYNASK